jgi:carbamoyltransferase
MQILGISCYYHDAAAVLLRDGQLIAAAEEERFSRIKHDYGFPHRAIRFCLEEGGIRGTDLDYVAFFEKPFRKFDRILMTVLQTYPKSWRVFRESMITWMLDKLWVGDVIESELGVPKDRVLFGEHHLSHAASAFLCSPFEEAAILTVDGVGEWTTTTWGTGRGNEIRLTHKIEFPHSLGLLYSAFTAFLGFEVNEGEYKVMGMAPYGTPRYVEKVWKLIHQNEDGSFYLNMDYFSFHHSTERTFNGRFTALFGEPRAPGVPFFTKQSGYPSYFGDQPSNYSELCALNQYYADVAASIQCVTENVLVRMADRLQERTRQRRLCIAGGVGLNSVANSRILRETQFEELFVQPAAGDGGGALGAALWVYHSLLGQPRTWQLEHAYWGKAYKQAEIASFLIESGIPHRRFDSDDELLGYVVNQLTNGSVIGRR